MSLKYGKRLLAQSTDAYLRSQSGYSHVAAMTRTHVSCFHNSGWPWCPKHDQGVLGTKRNRFETPQRLGVCRTRFGTNLPYFLPYLLQFPFSLPQISIPISSNFLLHFLKFPSPLSQISFPISSNFLPCFLKFPSQLSQISFSTFSNFLLHFLKFQSPFPHISFPICLNFLPRFLKFPSPFVQIFFPASSNFLPHFLKFPSPIPLQRVRKQFSNCHFSRGSANFIPLLFNCLLKHTTRSAFFY